MARFLRAVFVAGMGLFDRFTPKKPVSAAPSPAPSPSAEPPDARPAGPATISERLAQATALLEAKDVAGALTAYESILAEAGERADVLVTVSGELGSRGHVTAVIELVAPLYDAARHGPATGINLVQAYLAAQDTDAAQHMLDVLFALKRPELEDRLHGFSNALADLLVQGGPDDVPDDGGALPPAAAKVALVTISKPVWLYGLEAMTDDVLPPKQGKLRRIAFAQLAVLGLTDYGAALEQPEDELGRLARGIPLWFAESFSFSPHYVSVAAVGVITPPEQPARPMIFGGEWSPDNLRQLVDTATGGLDYIIAGALRLTAGDYELTLRVFDVKGFRERKKFVARWAPATADAELANVHAEIRRFMEWSTVEAPLAYAPPPAPRPWIDTLATSLGAFLAEKGVIPADRLPPLAPAVAEAAATAATTITASLAYLTLAERAVKLGAERAPLPPLAASPLVERARAILAGG